MEKNEFLIYNDLVFDLYTCTTLEEIKTNFLEKLRALIPYSYASLLVADPSSDTPRLYQGKPICVPDSFEDAELKYMEHLDEDPLSWVFHTKVSALIRESDILSDEERLNSPLYMHCYRKYNIYDTLQFALVNNRKFTGMITIFRTKNDARITDNDMFYLQSIGMHLRSVLCQILNNDQNNAQSSPMQIQELVHKYQLTDREQQILSMIFAFKTNEEIANELNIRDTTIQKHMQNIFRKMNVSSKWDLLKFRE